MGNLQIYVIEMLRKLLSMATLEYPSFASLPVHGDLRARERLHLQVRKE